MQSKCKEEILSVNSITWHRKTIGIFIIEWWLLRKLGILLPWSQTAKLLKSVEYVAAINGGDGFPTSMVQIHFIRASWKHGLLSNEHTGNTTSANTWAFSVTAQLR